MNALLGTVNASDQRLAERGRAWAPPRWFRIWMIAATRFGDGSGWAAVGLGLMASGPRGRTAAAAATAAALLASGTFMAIKRSCRRRRPCAIAPHPLFHVQPPDAFSFPSGHTMNAFAVATVLTLRFPSLSPGLLLLAGSIGASRVVLGLHFASDVWRGPRWARSWGGWWPWSTEEVARRWPMIRSRARRTTRRRGRAGTATTRTTTPTKTTTTLDKEP